MAFQEANRAGRYDGLIRGAQDFLKANQTDETEGKAPTDPTTAARTTAARPAAPTCRTPRS